MSRHRLGAGPEEDRAEVSRRHEEASSRVSRARESLAALADALWAREEAVRVARTWYDRMNAETREQLRRRAIDTSADRLSLIETVSRRYEEALARLDEAVRIYGAADREEAALAGRVEDLRRARVLNDFAIGRPGDAELAVIARAWTDHTLNKPGAPRPSVASWFRANELMRAAAPTPPPPPTPYQPTGPLIEEMPAWKRALIPQAVKDIIRLTSPRAAPPAPPAPAAGRRPTGLVPSLPAGPWGLPGLFPTL